YVHARITCSLRPRASSNSVPRASHRVGSRGCPPDIEDLAYYYGWRDPATRHVSRLRSGDEPTALVTNSHIYPRRGLHGEVLHPSVLQIVSGELQPGDPLPPEDDLTSDLSVSRTVLREAVRVLAAKGLVQAR